MSDFIGQVILKQFKQYIDIFILEHDFALQSPS